MADDESWQDEWKRTIAPAVNRREPRFRGALAGSAEPVAFSTIAPERFEGPRQAPAVSLGYAHLKGRR